MDLKQLVMLALQISIVCTVFGYGLNTRTAAPAAWTKNSSTSAPFAASHDAPETDVTR